MRNAEYSAVKRTSEDLASEATRQSAIGAFRVMELLTLQLAGPLRFELDTAANQTHSGVFLRMRNRRVHSIWTPHGEDVLQNPSAHSDEAAAAILAPLTTHPVSVEHTVVNSGTDIILAVTAIEDDLLPAPVLARPEHYLPEYLAIKSRNETNELLGEPLR